MLDRIRLSDFRNHAATRLEGAGRFNLLIGANGAGKTNVLEALSLFAPGRGLRRAQLADMAREPGEARASGGFAVGADLISGVTPVRIGTALRVDAPGRRVVQASGAPLPAARLAEWLSIGWLTPAMDRLFADSAGNRRRFLDRLVLALEPTHAAQSSLYEKALRERNRLMAGEARPDPQWLDALEREMADAGAQIARARAATVARLGEELAQVPEAPFARPALAVVPAAPADAGELAQAWKTGRAADRGAGRTLTGPHRDDLAVTMSGSGRAAAECSTGEQKAMLIAITLAHAGLAAGTRPLVLLLDEVAAHLDPVRRAVLYERLAATGAQVWMTGTEAEPFASLPETPAAWRVAGGAAERID